MAINGANFPEGKPHSFGQMIVIERERSALVDESAAWWSGFDLRNFPPSEKRFNAFFHRGFMNATMPSGARGRLFQAPIMFVQRSHSSGEHDLKIAGFPGELVRNL